MRSTRHSSASRPPAPSPKAAPTLARLLAHSRGPPLCPTRAATTTTTAAAPTPTTIAATNASATAPARVYTKTYANFYAALTATPTATTCKSIIDGLGLKAVMSNPALALTVFVPTDAVRALTRSGGRGAAVGARACGRRPQAAVAFPACRVARGPQPMLARDQQPA
jgi:hypothetical protein